jgi:NitT/TauT family transport system permease protein
VTKGILIPALLESLRPLLLGYVAAAVVGILIGLGIGASRTADAAFGLFVYAGFSTPLVALVPLFILWFGLGFTAKVAIVFALTIFPIIINTADGVRSVPKSWIEVGHAFDSPRRMILSRIILPASLPNIMTGLRIGVGRAVIGVVIAEFFTAINGLGAIVIIAGNNFQTAKMFVPIIVLMALGVGLTALVGVLERRVADWHVELAGRS